MPYRPQHHQVRPRAAHTERRFPPPREVHEATESFCIRDANGQALTQGTR